MDIKEKIIEYFLKLLNQPHLPGQEPAFILKLQGVFAKLGYRSEINNGNLIVKVPATKGYENLSPVVIQTNIDMPGVMEEGLDFNFFEDPIRIKVDENKEWLSSVGTNLGAANGIAIIYMLLLLEDKEIVHPELIFVLTRNKEVGMGGALNLATDTIKNAKYLINLGAENENYLVVSSAGSETVTATYTYEKKLTLGSVYELKVTGLSGSRFDVFTSQTLGNAARILAQIVGHLLATGLQLQVIDINCRSSVDRLLDEGTIKIITPLREEEIVNMISEYINVILPCYRFTDPNLKFTISPISKADKLMAFDRNSSGNIMFNLIYLPNGVEFNDNGVPLASSDISDCYTEGNNVYINERIKFINANYEGFIKSKISMFYSYTRGFIKVKDVIPPWVRRENSKLQKFAHDSWQELTGAPMQTKRFNGVLEPGIFSTKLPNLDIISIGPNIQNSFTINERINLDSASRVYELLKQILQKIIKEDQ